MWKWALTLCAAASPNVTGTEAALNPFPHHRSSKYRKLSIVPMRFAVGTGGHASSRHPKRYALITRRSNRSRNGTGCPARRAPAPSEADRCVRGNTSGLKSRYGRTARTPGNFKMSSRCCHEPRAARPCGGIAPRRPAKAGPRYAKPRQLIRRRSASKPKQKRANESVTGQGGRLPRGATPTRRKAGHSTHPLPVTSALRTSQARGARRSQELPASFGRKCWRKPCIRLGREARLQASD